MIITEEGRKIAEIIDRLTVSVLTLARRVDHHTVGCEDVIADLTVLQRSVKKQWGIEEGTPTP